MKGIIFLAIISTITVLCSTTRYLYIKPTLTAPCSDSPCLTLEQCVTSPSEYFQSNTMVFFLPGVHVLETSSLYIQGITNISLVGHSMGTVTPSTIQCTEKTGLTFYLITSLHITNLSVSGCHHDTFPGAIVISSVTDLMISGLQVQNSTGYGIYALEIYGHSQISDSAFMYNSGSKDALGGHMYVGWGVFGCSETRSLMFTISSTTFLHAGTVYPNQASSSGLQLKVYCSYDINIHIRNISMDSIGQSNPPKYGSLSVIIDEPQDTSGFRFQLVVENSVIANALSSEFGGGIYFTTYRSTESTFCHRSAHEANVVQFSNVTISNSTSLQGGGMAIALSSVCSKYEIFLNNVEFWDNKAVITEKTKAGIGDVFSSTPGGNMLVFITFKSLYVPFITINNTTFRSGQAMVGGGLFANLELSSGSYSRNKNTVSWLTVSNCIFVGNTAIAGGGIYLITNPVGRNPSSDTTALTPVFTKIQNCTLEKNTGEEGSALYAVASDSSSTFFHSYVHVLFELVSFCNNNPHPFSEVGLYYLSTETESVTVLVSSVYNATFSNSEFNGNIGTALSSRQSNIFFHGEINFHDNRGNLGGGMVLLRSYMMLPSMDTMVSFVNNTAQRIGGAIFVQDEFSPRGRYPCFYQFDIPFHTPLPEITTRIQFENNSAVYGGSALYGGDIDRCNQIFIYAQVLFDTVFEYSTQTGPSVIASNPYGICLCENNIPNCNISRMMVESFPGDIFTSSVVAVGQRSGAVPGVVLASFAQEDSPMVHSLEEFQDSQPVGMGCSNITYTVSSGKTLEHIQLTVENPSINTPARWFVPPILSVTLLPCPLGFNLSGTPPKCNCASPLIKHDITCDILTKTIRRPAAKWIGYYPPDTTSATNTSGSHGVLVYDYCPFDYCKPDDTEIFLNNSDEQCALGHSGVLCGACQDGLSIALGTSRCINCSNVYLLLLLPFALAGLILVLLMKYCQLTVSESTLSGLIFYANIIHVTRAHFFQQCDKVTDFLSVFIAWLNLDLGIETCFYNGMDTYAKTWLQFVFPVYIWVLVITMIVSSYYSTTATKLFGRHSVKILATLFLLSFTKVARTIVAALSFVVLMYPDKSKRAFWLYDGNIKYLHGEHIPLFVISVLALILLLIPYTLVLLCTQLVQSKGNYRLLLWLKHLLDAYAGPYKDKYRFWTGLLLVFRIILFLVFAFNVSRNPALDLYATAIVSITLMFASFVLGGVYKSWPLSILEVSFFLNLSIISVSMIYVLNAGGNRCMAVDVTVGTVFITFLAIIVYHVILSIKSSRFCRNLVGKFHHQPTIDQELTETAGNNEGSESEDEDNELHQVQVPCLHLTFDREQTSGEAILMPVDDNP